MARSVSPAARAPTSRPTSAASGSTKPPKPRVALAPSASSSSNTSARPPRAGVPLAPEVFVPFRKGRSASAGARAGSTSARSVPPPSPGKARGVSEILRAQETEGLGRSYLCKMEDGKKVQVRPELPSACSPSFSSPATRRAVPRAEQQLRLQTRQQHEQSTSLTQISS